MVKRLTHWWDWPSIGILFLAVFTSASRLVVTKWSSQLGIVESTCLLGLVLGFLLGKSFYHRHIVFGFALAYTLIGLPLRLSSAITGDISLLKRFIIMIERLSLSVNELLTGQPIVDSLFFITILSLVYWVMALLSGYSLTRSANYLLSVLPAGIAIIILQVYDPIPIRTWFMAIYIFLSIALLGRIMYLSKHITWKEKRVFVSLEARYDLTNGILISAAILILVSWSLPSPLTRTEDDTSLWQLITQPWHNIRQRINNIFASIESPSEFDFYGNRLNLGTGNSLSEDVVFEVHLQSIEVKPVRFYWRGRVYDTYEGQWTSSAIGTQNFFPDTNENIPVPDITGRHIADITFKTGNNLFTIYTAPQPLWINRKSRIHYNLTPDGSTDIVVIQAIEMIFENSTYLTRSAINNPTISELRAAGDSYPEWVTERYLQLPVNFSSDIKELSEEVTRGAKTPYDKAARITTYLRENITYKSTIPNPPFGRDPLEWVLFESKEGFCNYYATAEVLMLRSQGIPARLAVGFSQGEVDKTGASYSIKQRDAHAWPEVYFPKIGWVEFEPTANQNILERPIGIQLEPGPRNEDTSSNNPAKISENVGGNLPEDIELVEAQNAPTTTKLWGIILLGATSIIILSWPLNFRYGVIDIVSAALDRFLIRLGFRSPDWLQALSKRANLSPIERTFGIVTTSLKWLGNPPAPHETASQRAITLCRLIPRARESVQILTDELQISVYSLTPANMKHARQAYRIIFFYSIGASVMVQLERIKKKFILRTRL
ncbi:MAG: transglutaminase domain-containing protein [Anaerolineales bacterium]|nr:transglutaminase domain-containing protein [Anaerolineales bacterium]